MTLAVAETLNQTTFPTLSTSRMTLPLTVLQNMARQNGADTTDIWQTNIIDRYWCRPLQAPFTDMCLADFVAGYRVVRTKYEDEEATTMGTVTQTLAPAQS